MITFIPIRSTDVLSERVRKSIMAQTIPSNIELIETAPVSTGKRKGEFQGRDMIRDRARNSDWINDEFVVTSDSDTWHLYTDNYEIMHDFLKKNENYGAVSLWRSNSPMIPPESKHVILGCVMWRQFILANLCTLSGDNADYDTCCCWRYAQSIKNQGKEFGFLDGLKRIEHMRYS